MPKTKLSALGKKLANLRKRPCLLFANHFMHRSDATMVRVEISNCRATKLDVVVHSPGGDPDAAYMIARDLGRSFDEVTFFVPLLAKSAATLMCLVGTEFVLGQHGEMGPIDVQIPEPQPGELSEYRSCLERFKALEQLQRHALETYDFVVAIGLEHHMNLLDACQMGVELTGKLMEPLYAQIKPDKVGQSARNLEVAEMYATRIVIRYHPGLDERQARQMVRRLGRHYPSHGFIIDLEELVELGLPAREPTPEEAAIMLEMELLFPQIVAGGMHWTSLVEPDQVKKVTKKRAKKATRAKKRAPKRGQK